MSVFPLFIGTNWFMTRGAREEHFRRAKNITHVALTGARTQNLTVKSRTLYPIALWEL